MIQVAVRRDAHIQFILQSSIPETAYPAAWKGHQTKRILMTIRKKVNAAAIAVITRDNRPVQTQSTIAEAGLEAARLFPRSP